MVVNESPGFPNRYIEVSELAATHPEEIEDVPAWLVNIDLERAKIRSVWAHRIVTWDRICYFTLSVSLVAYLLMTSRYYLAVVGTEGESRLLPLFLGKVFMYVWLSITTNTKLGIGHSYIGRLHFSYLCKTGVAISTAWYQSDVCGVDRGLMTLLIFPPVLSMMIGGFATNLFGARIPAQQNLQLYLSISAALEVTGCGALVIVLLSGTIRSGLNGVGEFPNCTYKSLWWSHCYLLVDASFCVIYRRNTLNERSRRELARTILTTGLIVGQLWFGLLDTYMNYTSK